MGIVLDIHKYSVSNTARVMVSKSQKEHPASCRLVFLQRPHGAPRGLLMHYALYKIAQRPSHGYELLQDIESRTEGAWRPGAGSIYPMLKKMVDLAPSDARFILKEYALNLERQLDWANSTLNKVGEERIRPVQTIRKIKEHLSK